MRFIVGERAIEFKSPISERSTNTIVFVGECRQEFRNSTDVPERGVGKIILAPLPNVAEPKPGAILRRPRADRRPQESSGWRVVVALHDEDAILLTGIPPLLIVAYNHEEITGVGLRYGVGVKEHSILSDSLSCGAVSSPL